MRLEDTIKQEIQHNGPMDVGAFMARVVAYYYNSRDPFGEGGDFTTAPEISQIFGELLGAWAADCWTQMGRPSKFMLVECGPGRGTLMVDALRATAKIPGFHEAAQIHLIENSESLKARQRDVLQDFDVSWHDGLEGVPDNAPLILLANEFLDALPIRQFQRADGKWKERVIGVDGAGNFHFGLIPTAQPQNIEGDFYETSPACELFVKNTCERLKAQGGAALFIDYGYVEGHGDTLQAVKNHDYVPVLEQVGEADLTAHVDFAALSEGLVTTQGEFLRALGISQRAAMLKQKATESQAKDIDEAVGRLTSTDQMGELFKVMAFSSDDINLAGF